MTDAVVTIRCTGCLSLNSVQQTKLHNRLACGKCKAALDIPQRPLAVHCDSYDTQVAGWSEKLLTVFIADMCIYSKIIDPLLQEIARTRFGKLKVLLVDAEIEDVLAHRFKIRKTPTFILYKNGVELSRMDGAPREKNDVIKWIDDHDSCDISDVTGTLTGKFNYEKQTAPERAAEAPVSDGQPKQNMHSGKELKIKNIVVLEQHLGGLKEVKGFRAAGVMNFTGEMLASQSVDDQINLSLVGTTFNDIFRAAHEASRKIGLDACRETAINTPKGLIIMLCSGVNAEVHFHLISIVANDGNHTLMKMQLEKLMPVVMQDLA